MQTFPLVGGRLGGAVHAFRVKGEMVRARGHAVGWRFGAPAARQGSFGPRIGGEATIFEIAACFLPCHSFEQMGWDGPLL